MQNLTKPRVAIACGGTGGHLFPGLAVARALTSSGCDVLLLVSRKEVDEQATAGIQGVGVHSLPAVGLAGGNFLRFAQGFCQSYRLARRIFRKEQVGAVLAMGGFTSAPPAIVARRLGALAFLHESNAFPGRANRFLARWVNAAFVGFPAAQPHFARVPTMVTGTPVRAEFQRSDDREIRARLGLDPDRPLLLTMGGSQGAAGVNRCVLGALELIRKLAPNLQFAHLTGKQDLQTAQAAYSRLGAPALVEAFSQRMHLMMGAATVAVSRSGASSLAELAATELPALLVPYPQATDNHQALNACEYVRTGAAMMMNQGEATPEAVARAVEELLQPGRRNAMRPALRNWHQPAAAERISNHILRALASGRVLQSSEGLSSARQVLA